MSPGILADSNMFSYFLIALNDLCRNKLSAMTPVDVHLLVSLHSLIKLVAKRLNKDCTIDIETGHNGLESRLQQRRQKAYTSDINPIKAKYLR